MPINTANYVWTVVKKLLLTQAPSCNHHHHYHHRQTIIKPLNRYILSKSLKRQKL